jgi:hypothetical protein
VQNPRRVGGPETDHADPSDPRSPVVQVGRDVIPPKDERAGIVTTSEGPGGWGEDSVGGKPRKASTVGSPSGAPGASTDSSREQGPEGGRTRPSPLGGHGGAATSGGQGLRKEHLSRTRGTPWRVKPRDAPALRAPVGLAVEVAKGVPKPRTRHAATVGAVATNHADPPGRDCVVGHESPGEAASRDESLVDPRVDR